MRMSKDGLSGVVGLSCQALATMIEALWAGVGHRHGIMY
jgi:hypothetical protein